MAEGPLTTEVSGTRVTSKQTRSNRGVASSETAREINRNIILHTIHAHQPVSRADLARRTGLQASTVSTIVGQLIDESWVLTGEHPALINQLANDCRYCAGLQSRTAGQVRAAHRLVSMDRVENDVPIDLARRFAR